MPMPDNPYSLVIDIGHNPEVLRIIVESVGYLPKGWELCPNIAKNYELSNPKCWAGFPNKTPRFISFRFTEMTIGWAYSRPKGGEIQADTPFKISKVLDYVYTVSAKKGRP